MIGVLLGEVAKRAKSRQGLSHLQEILVAFWVSKQDGIPRGILVRLLLYQIRTAPSTLVRELEEAGHELAIASAAVEHPFCWHFCLRWASV